MEKILTSLQAIAQSQRILQPEQTIELCLMPLRPYWTQKSDLLSTDIVPKVEQVLLSLLKINRGDLNVACATSIGINLYHLYNLESNPHKYFWNLISNVTDNTSKANIVAFNYVVSKLGRFNKSSLGKITQHLLNLKDQTLHFPALIALHSLFKECGQSLSKSAWPAFKFAKKYVVYNTNSNEAIQIAALRLIEILFQYPDEVDIKKIVNCIKTVSNEPLNTKFVIDLACVIIAKCAIYSIPEKCIMGSSNESENEVNAIADNANDSDFKIPQKSNNEVIAPNQANSNRKQSMKGSKSTKKKQSVLLKAYEIILQFKTHFGVIFGYFMDYLEPEFVFNNVRDLFDFVIGNIDQSYIKKVTCFFGRDIHSLFYESMRDKPMIDVNLMMTLTYDEETARETAGIAHTKIWSSDLIERNASARFFISLATYYQKVALEELHVALHFIAMPPDDSETLEREYEGMTLIAALIISSLNCSIIKEKTLINRFINYVLKEKADEELYVRSLFKVIAPLKKEFFEGFDIEPLLEQYVNKIMKKRQSDQTENLNLPMALIESLLAFLSIHHNYKIATEFSKFCFSIINILSPVMIMPVVRLFNSADINVPSSYLLSMLHFFLNYIVVNGVPLDYIAMKIPVLMKIPEEVVNIGKTSKHLKKINIFEVSPLFLIDSTVLVKKILDALPRYFERLNKEDAFTFIDACLNSQNKVAGFISLLIILLSQTETNEKIPKRLHSMILNSLAEKEYDVISTQIACECIAIHLSHYPDFVSDTNESRRQETSMSCFIESAIVRRINLNDQEIVSIILRTSKRIKNPVLTNYVLHELTSIYETKSEQMVSLNMGEQQLQQLLNLLCDVRFVSTYQMYLISNCIQKLIPIVLPNLIEKSTVIMLIIALDNFRNSLNPFCKQYFFDLFRSLFSLSQNVALNFDLKIPRPSMRLQSKLVACGALADLSKRRPFQENLINKMPPFFILLQRTKDQRVEEFIVSAAECFGRNFLKSHEENPEMNDELGSWFKLARQILASNSIIGFGKATVEPNTAVKHASLNILYSLLPALAQTKPLMTACMDDCMTSTLRAIESRRIELQEIAYLILSKFLSLFQFFVTDQGVKLLELYDAQFSNAIRYAFPDSMNVASSYLTKYLDFAFLEYQKNEKSCLLLIETLIKNLKTIGTKMRTSGYYAISSKLCVLSQRYPNVAEMSSSFLKELTPHFFGLINDIIKLRTDQVKQNEQNHSSFHRSFMTLFRDAMSPFCSDFLNSFIWLQKNYPSQSCQSLDISSLSAFLLLELTSSTESWRSASAFSAFSSLLQSYDEISDELFLLIVNTMCNVALWDQSRLTPFVSKFLHYAGKIAAERNMTSVFVALTSLALASHQCDAYTLGLIFKYTDRNIIENSIEQFADLIINELIESISKSNSETQNAEITKLNDNAFSLCLLNEDKAIAAITILFDMSSNAIPLILSRIFNQRIEHSVRFQMVSIARAFARIETRVCIDRIASFLIEHFDDGGLETIAEIVIKRPEIGKELLKRGIISRSVKIEVDYKSIINNDENNRQYKGSSFKNSGLNILHFYELILDHFGSVEIVCEEIAKSCLFYISLFGNDRSHGEKVTATAIQIMKRCEQTKKDCMKLVYRAFPDDKRQEITKIMKKWSSKKIVKKVSLLKFSNKVPRRRNVDDGNTDEWLSLDDDES